MTSSIRELGDYVRAVREERGLSQDDLANAISPPASRTAVAHLEQGRRLPSASTLEAICTHLGVPRKFWAAMLDSSQAIRASFEDSLGELVGERVSLRDHDHESSAVAHRAVLGLFNTSRTENQLHAGFSAVLVNYGVMPPSAAFFHRFLGTEAFISVDMFDRRVRAYQAQAIRLYSSFAAGYRHLSCSESLQRELSPLLPKDDASYRERVEWTSIEDIPEDRLPDLGYISAARVRKEQVERSMVADFLNELADGLVARGAAAVESYSAKRRRKIGSLLRVFRSTLPHDLMSPLFTLDPDLLRREAKIIGPKAADDIARMEETQATGLRNLARYLTADFMDLYVATSMRSDADFASVNSFVRRLFARPEVHPLKLRYFNPTQSWIEDRVAKGLVEALMLKRAAFTIYLAQKADSFGKDSEASVALGQGKPVIVFVPSLRVPEVDIDSETLGQLGRKGLQLIVEREADGEDREVDETTDDQALLAQVLSLRLAKASGTSLAIAAREHWADFDLYGEDSRLQETERASYRAWLDACVKSELDVAPEPTVRAHFIGILVACATNAEKRATVFREVHPLALQVILSTGVLNGILVVRSVEGCAAVLSLLVRNTLDLELVVDEHNYRLVERSTRSTVRVIARHALIGNAFEAFYQDALRNV